MGRQFKQGGGLYPRLRIGAVLLAAGEGRRMGGIAKPLIRKAAVGTASKAVSRSEASTDNFINPVCGMAIGTDNPLHVEEYEGFSYSFCCDGGWTTFRKDPAKYAEIHLTSMRRVTA